MISEATVHSFISSVKFWRLFSGHESSAPFISVFTQSIFTKCVPSLCLRIHHYCRHSHPDSGPARRNHHSSEDTRWVAGKSTSQNTPVLVFSSRINLPKCWVGLREFSACSELSSLELSINVITYNVLYNTCTSPTLKNEFIISVVSVCMFVCMLTHFWVFWMIKCIAVHNHMSRNTSCSL